MKKLIYGSKMKEIDSYAINEIGIPSIALMERAAFSVFCEMEKMCSKQENILIVCGTGNNGADGLALARMLKLKGYRVDIQVIGDILKATQEFKIQKSVTDKLEVMVAERPVYESYDYIVDALFGVGLCREITGVYKETIERMNESNAVKIAIDIPSGLSGDTGAILGAGFVSDITVTFGILKTGLVISQGPDYAGQVIVADIGFPQTGHADIFAHEEQDLLSIPRRRKNSNKGSYGRLLVIAGSENMAGAAFLCAKSAYRVGTGLVQILTPKENREILQTLLPEAILKTYDASNPDFEEISGYIDRASAIVAGPGLGISENAMKLIEKVMLAKKKTVIDADGLNIISQFPHLTGCYHSDIIITPHIREMSRLTCIEEDKIKNDLISTCRGYCEEHKISCILKDSGTVICTGDRIYINLSGNPGMATAGAGDVLAGIAGGLLAMGLGTDIASSIGPFIHGLAGDRTVKKTGESALMASDIIDGLKDIIGD
ncbi:NAD(P)H-hydrate dehydratase [Parasporobacterium paucivorans]|uniref:Bifunctional NAD(P)H-hydrate repair enzyme n=1 Tax=Parasporobacterium paucivorans DSM 15970 TaxID=1122934 RepID=A0A1M6EQ91_9FIRM|nr:NAD(P)H-hydrate dehydratase [Parasporobacterium paucivorans]SHI87480.1 NAD(P)H-hydrate epimerase [Parasporobacterium paucivorans DSM 15970]